MPSQTYRPRYIALSDIDNEPDDAESFVRLLLYSNDIDIRGVIAVTSTWLRNEVHPETLSSIAEGYRLAHPNLLKHDERYPSPEYIESIILPGNPTFGMKEIGEGQESQGSNWIIKMVDETPIGELIHVGLWGGANTLAQALWTVRATRSKEQVEDFIEKVQVYSISDQDDAGPWIRRHFPMLRYIVSIAGENCYSMAAWTGISADITGGFSGPDRSLVSREWITKHIQVGPLGQKYPMYEFIMEGDTPAFLGIIPNGLNIPSRIDYGGWGGRYKKLLDPESRHYHDSGDTVTSPVDGKTYSASHATIWRWREEVQHDFAARMQWTLIEPTASCNHPPTVIVNGHDTDEPLYVDATLGETITLDASKSFDIDGDELVFEWFQYKEADYRLPVPFDVATLEMHGTANTPRLRVTFPAKTAMTVGFTTIHENGQDFHIVLKVTDTGVPALTRYKRIIAKVRV